jgi:hypothetical protein
MGRLLIALDPGVGVDAAGFAVAWNKDRKAVGTGRARAEPAGPRQFISGVELVIVPLQANQVPDAVYDVLQGVLKHLRHDSAERPEVLLSAPPSGDGDLLAVISTAPGAPAAAAASPPRPRMAVITAVFTFLCWLSHKVSIASWHNLDAREGFIHAYVLVWLGVLSGLLALCPISGWLRFAVLGIAFYRLQDLLFSTLDNALRLTKRAQERPAYSWRTPLMLALVNIIQIVLIFAIAYLLLTGQNPAAFAHPPSGPFSAFFLSWISLPPLGGGAAPLSAMARDLTITEEATGLLIIVIAIGRFLAAPG